MASKLDEMLVTHLLKESERKYTRQDTVVVSISQNMQRDQRIKDIPQWFYHRYDINHWYNTRDNLSQAFYITRDFPNNCFQ